MINDDLLIDLDDYLDLSNFSLCTKEFKDKFHLIPDESKSTGYFTPDVSIEDKVDSQTIMLRVLKDRDDWKDWGLIDKEEKWKDGPLCDLFPNIREFISTLPFKSIGRLIGNIFISIGQKITGIIGKAFNLSIFEVTLTAYPSSLAKGLIEFNKPNLDSKIL